MFNGKNTKSFVQRLADWRRLFSKETILVNLTLSLTQTKKIYDPNDLLALSHVGIIIHIYSIFKNFYRT